MGLVAKALFLKGPFLLQVNEFFVRPMNKTWRPVIVESWYAVTGLLHTSSLHPDSQMCCPISGGGRPKRVVWLDWDPVFGGLQGENGGA